MMLKETMETPFDPCDGCGMAKECDEGSFPCVVKNERESRRLLDLSDVIPNTLSSSLRQHVHECQERNQTKCNLCEMLVTIAAKNEELERKISGG
jgi:hypothetical protein